MDQPTELERYERHLKSRALRPASIGAYTGWVRRLAAALPVPLDRATPDHLEGWVAAHNWAPNSHQKAVQAVQYFYRWAHSQGLVVTDPAADLRPARAPSPVPSPCPEGVYGAALAAATGTAYWKLRLAGDTGLRRAELAAVHTDGLYVLPSGPMLKVVGKGGKSRWVPVPADVAEWLTDLQGWVFPNREGTGPLEASSVGRWYARRLGVKAHSLRHRYATNAYRGSRDINAVKQLLGHSSVATTQVYVAVADQDMIDAAAWAWTTPAGKGATA